MQGGGDMDFEALGANMQAMLQQMGSKFWDNPMVCLESIPALAELAYEVEDIITIGKHS